jgi:hypothetical protein
MDNGALTKQLLDLLEETWCGTPLPGKPDGWGYFSDEQAGFNQSLAGLTARQAAQPIGGTSIAQHVHHSAFGSRTFAAWLRGEDPDADWAASWHDVPGEAPVWESELAALQAALAELRMELERHAEESSFTLSLALGAVTHLVYHLGALRQKLLLLEGQAG